MLDGVLTISCTAAFISTNVSPYIEPAGARACRPNTTDHCCECSATNARYSLPVQCHRPCRVFPADANGRTSKWGISSSAQGSAIVETAQYRNALCCLPTVVAMACRTWTSLGDVPAAVEGTNQTHPHVWKDGHHALMGKFSDVQPGTPSVP